MSLYVLDIDMLTLVEEGHVAVGRRFLEQRPEAVAVTVLTVEEQLSGWYTALRKAKQPRKLAWAYQRQAVRRQAAAFSEAPRQAGIRRLYTYVIALVALGVLTSGVAGLLWTLCDVLFAPGAATGDFWRERVALFATLVIVGLPVWLLHWRPSAGSVDEARSLARRLYVYLSLIALLKPGYPSGFAQFLSVKPCHV